VGLMLEFALVVVQAICWVLEIVLVTGATALACVAVWFICVCFRRKK
jgi:hypothetical protein